MSTTRLLSCGHEHTEAELISAAAAILARRRRPGVGGRKPKPSHCFVCTKWHPSAKAAAACCTKRAWSYAIPEAIIQIREVADAPTHRTWKLTRELQRPVAKQFVVSSWCTDVRLSEACFSELAPAEAEFERRVRTNR